VRYLNYFMADLKKDQAEKSSHDFADYGNAPSEKNTNKLRYLLRVLQ